MKCLQDVEDGKIKRLMGLWPPGAGKSIFSSVVFPTHYLGRFPGRSTIVASYGSDLPKKFGRRARSVVRQPIYKRIFGTELSTESQAVDEWTLTNGSEWMATGILSGITGNRVDGVIWDDLIKGRAEADSKIVRDKTGEAYMNDLMTRKKPGGFEVAIGTRWHEDDPMGRILPINYNGESGLVKGQDGNDWFVVCLPAEAEREDDILGRKLGERLWPEWFTEDHFAPFKLQARTWSALFQQRPAPETGNFFQVEWLRPYGDTTRTPMPHRDSLHVYGASDYATTDEGGNYTVHVVAGVDPEHNIYILDLWRGRTSSDRWVEIFCDLVAEWKPMGWAEETGQIRAGVGPFLHKRMMERGIYIARKQFPTRGDKQIRAQSIRGRMAMGKVYFPIAKPFFSELKRELLTFPAGKTDDQCLAEDTLILMANGTEKPIYSVMVGELVATPIGPKKVLESKITDVAAKVFRIKFSNGSELVATGNHPVFVEGKGFTRVDALGIMDVVKTKEPCSCLVKSGWMEKLKFLNITVYNIGTIGTELIFKLVAAGDRVFCIDTFGKISMAPSQMVMRSIIRMETNSITNQKIWNVFQLGNIGISILWLGKGLKNRKFTLRGLDPKPIFGIRQRKDGKQTNEQLEFLGIIGKRLQKYVHVVRNYFKHHLLRDLSFAQESAVSVIKIEAPIEPMVVRNLMVTDAHAYYANRVLVHNCDALGLLGQILDLMFSVAHDPKAKTERKIISTDPDVCNVSLQDFWDLDEYKDGDDKPKTLRIK